MNNDIRIQSTFKGHRKRRRLSNILKCEATGYLIDLWITIAQERPSGVLTNWDNNDISLAAGWPGEPDVFVKALIDSKLLDVNGDKIFHTHDWEDHQPWVAGTSERKESARKAGIASAISRANQRLDKSNGMSTEVNESLKSVQRNGNGMSTEVNPRTESQPRTIPYHTKPIPLPKPIKDMYGEFKNVSLSPEEHQKLITSLGEKQTSELIERLSGYIASKGVKYKSHYATMLNWSRKDGESAKNNRKGLPGNQPAGAFDDLQ